MSRLRDMLDAGEFVITGEVAPPKGADLASMHAAVDVLAPHCHALNVTDNHLDLSRGIVRVDQSNLGAPAELDDIIHGHLDPNRARGYQNHLYRTRPNA